MFPWTVPAALGSLQLITGASILVSTKPPADLARGFVAAFMLNTYFRCAASSFALSVFSQENSERPKWPYAAVFW